MERAPDDEGPPGPMPQARDHHGEGHVPVCTERPVAIAAEGDVQVMLEPRRQADVPPAPELA